MSEQIDRKLLKIQKQSNKLTGELYKGILLAGNTTFNLIRPYDNNSNIWDGYELRYPKSIQDVGWERLHNVTDFVMNSSDTYFRTNVWRRFNYENYLDYFIFLNLIRATDNTAKNIYTARYRKLGYYFFVPWDLDGCFGTKWTGARDTNVDDILANSFQQTG